MLKRIFRNWPAKTTCLVVALLILIANRSINFQVQYFTIPLDLLLHESVSPSSTYPRQVQIRMRGEVDAIQQITAGDITASVDFTNNSNTGTYSAPVSIQRSGKALRINPLEIRVEPEIIELGIEKLLRKEVSITAITSDFLPAGYKMVSSRLTPDVVVIAGPSSRVREITHIETREIDLSNRTRDFSTRVQLLPPNPFIQFPLGDVVEYQLSIEEVPILNEFNSVELVLLDLDENLRLVSPLRSGKVQVQALLKDIEGVLQRDLRLIVDASFIRTVGTYEVSVTPQVPLGLTVLGYEPVTVSLQVERRDE